MNLRYKAFSLTELMIVMVIIALLFVALAPIFTKRHISQVGSTESIWNFVSADTERDSYFDPGNENWTSSIYMGMTPSTSNTNAGKLVINSGGISYDGKNYKQPQIQFRYSNSFVEQGRGVNAATLYVDSNNIVFGPSLPGVNLDYTTVYGLSNLHGISTNAKGVTVLGNNAMGNAKITQSGTSQYIIAAGSYAADKLGSINTSTATTGIFIGAHAGAGGAEVDSPPQNDIAIGYKSMSKEGTLGSNNVFVGAYTGNGFNTTSASYNTIIGSTYPGTSASYNTIIGYGVYDNGKSDTKAMTAIGYGACNSVSGNNSGSRVCIGYNSGVSTNNSPSIFNTDSGEHIFIGGKPSSTKTRGFAGRSILEIHSTGGSNSYGNVVINSNLVVRGNYFPSDSNGSTVYNVFKTTADISAENQYYRCKTDAFGMMLNYSSYYCTAMEIANPKSINVLYKGGNCATRDGYTTGSGCPNIVSSDIRLKSNIERNSDGLDKILKLNPYYYAYKNDPSVTHVGVIAQDLRSIFPDAVSKDKDGFLQIRWEDMFYALVNSIKELALKIDDLTSRIVNLKNDITNVHNDQKDINKSMAVLNNRLNKLERK